MRKNKASITAQGVAAVRAIAQLNPQVPGFSDPTAKGFLSGKFLKKVELGENSGIEGRAFKQFRGAILFSQQFRTVMLDRAISETEGLEQLVILGAGLDGRAWRLPALKNCHVYEVDHPASQAYKKDHAVGLKPAAAKLTYVPVDFTKDSLEECLRGSGFDPSKKTAWILEGLVMYLPTPALEANLLTASLLSAPGSRIAITYLKKRAAKYPWKMRVFLWLIGEPLRATYTESELKAVCEGQGWNLVSDTGIHDWAPAIAPQIPVEKLDLDSPIYERIWVGQKV